MQVWKCFPLANNRKLRFGPRQKRHVFIDTEEGERDRRGGGWGLRGAGRRGRQRERQREREFSKHFVLKGVSYSVRSGRLSRVMGIFVQGKPKKRKERQS